MMAAVAKYRDDIAGAIVTGGTSTAYTVSSFQVFDSLAHLNGQTIAFTPHVTNGATVTLNVDGLGAKPLRSAPANELLAGMLVQGTPYTCTYSNLDAAFYLRGFYVSPYSVPLGSCIDYFGVSAPNTSFALAYGQAISRSTYAALFSLFSTTYGTGDGSTTFNIPDLRGRVLAGKDDMGGSAASRLTSSYFGGTAINLGAAGGSESHTLTEAEIPSHQHDVFIKDPGHSHNEQNIDVGGVYGSSGSGTPFFFSSGHNLATTANTTGITIGSVSGTANDNKTAAKGGGGGHAIVQPTIICNKLIRIL